MFVSASPEDPDVWYPDGNLVIIAESTHFRTYTGTINKFSDNFLQLAEVTHAVGTGYAAEGCKVVRVTDSAHDLRHVLRIIHEGFYYRQRTQGVVEFEYHASAARLSNKYNLVAIAHQVTTHLSELFPSSFDLWDKNESLRTDRTHMSPEDAIEAVKLFRKLAWNDMLPAALYLCAQLSPEILLGGHVRADGTLERLSRADRVLCIELKMTFIKESDAMFAQLCGKGRGQKCETNGLFGSEICRDTLAEQVRRHDRDNLHGDPLGTHLRKKIGSWEKSKLVCVECARELRVREKDLRRSLWRKLPKMMKLQV
ncbi:hypothetical protein L227DRAFT_657196 [Lentinus tigrinus ALCF2SS1-6]|uniref:BTB domain-containing protein n=1 Tax=Lentinus tigrinus ALCF2SS1-6 TaxID=1328759 RepID=A0A5C2RTP2_9APHY|nr:hypothetical protein L227DRAFT_657196 [Lentinus tigrinus ALCF2SS1-6]